MLVEVYLEQPPATVSAAEVAHNPVLVYEVGSMQTDDGILSFADAEGNWIAEFNNWMYWKKRT